MPWKRCQCRSLSHLISLPCKLEAEQHAILRDGLCRASAGSFLASIPRFATLRPFCQATDIPVRRRPWSTGAFDEAEWNGYLYLDGTKSGTSCATTQVRGHGQALEPLENQDILLASRPVEYLRRIGLPAVWSPASVLPGPLAPCPLPPAKPFADGTALHGTYQCRRVVAWASGTPAYYLY